MFHYFTVFMSEKTAVKYSKDIAQEVAKIILEHSYRIEDSRFPIFNQSVKDVLLFGSALEKEGHDVDLLAIHNLSCLKKYGVITKYDDKESCVVPDLNPEKTFEDGVYRASSILDSIGGKTFNDESFTVIFTLKELFRERILPNLEEISPAGTVYRGKKIEIPYVGKIEFKDAETKYKAMDQFDRIVKDRIEEMRVIKKIEDLFKSCGFETREINSILDLQIMHQDLLFPDKMQEERELAIKQCRDPTFWYTVLSFGRLYNPDSGKFEAPITDKYPHALELFKV